MRRDILTWTVVAAVVVGAFVGTVVILNASLYSASGFVRSYLHALERKDAEGALELAGASENRDASTELLTRDGMGEVSGIRLISDDTDEEGLHHVVYGWEAGGESGQSAFTVRHTGTFLAFFSTWEFETSPLAVVELTIAHADTFTANGIELFTPAQNKPAPYLAFAPGSYTLDHESTYLTAVATVVTVSDPGTIVPGELDIQANEKFVAAAQKAITTALDECTTQKVLQPTGCPFGQPITNRIVTDPEWSIVEYPTATVVPARDANVWSVPPTSGIAHLVVDVKSLFDGSVSTLDADVPFDVGFLITILADETFVVSANG